MAKAQKNSAAVAQKWSQRLGGSTQQIKDGIMGVQVAPTQAAAAQQDAYVQGVQDAASSGKWKRGLQRVDLGTWQQLAIQKGIPRIASGAAAAIPKMQSFMDQWLPYEQQLQQKLAATPRGTKEQNKQRMVAAFDHNSAFKRS